MMSYGNKPVGDSMGDRVREIRLALKMKQAEFSTGIGISIPTLSSIETSKGNLTLDQFVKIVKDFNVNPDYLLFGDKPMFRDPSKKSYYSDLDKFDANPETVEKFLYYFKNSGIIQLSILAEFQKRLMVEQDIIDKEIAERLKGKK
jgi:transcriptional regulator with XRE-family HTH domain